MPSPTLFNNLFPNKQQLNQSLAILTHSITFLSILKKINQFLNILICYTEIAFQQRSKFLLSQRRRSKN